MKPAPHRNPSLPSAAMNPEFELEKLLSEPKRLKEMDNCVCDCAYQPDSDVPRECSAKIHKCGCGRFCPPKQCRASVHDPHPPRTRFIYRPHCSEPDETGLRHMHLVPAPVLVPLVLPLVSQVMDMIAFDDDEEEAMIEKFIDFSFGVQPLGPLSR